MHCTLCGKSFDTGSIWIRKEEQVIMLFCSCGTEIEMPWKGGIKKMMEKATENREKILIIKCIRALTGANLRDAKDIVEAITDM